jgi:hypothetical protein
MRTGFRRIRQAVLAGCLLLSAGCQIVKVQDQFGNPVVGAQITTQFDQVGIERAGPTAATNQWGVAALPIHWSIKKTPTSMKIRKPGYMPVGIEYPLDAEVRILMEKISNIADPTPTK